MTKIIICDVETTTKNKGNAFTRSNKLVNIGIKTNTDTHILYTEDHQEDFIQSLLDEAELMVVFAGKFDLHWLRRYGYKFDHLRIFDCQLAEFLLSYQQYPYPSLDKVASKYGLGTKLDIVKTEYWEKGIDTDAVPREILDEYLEQDLKLTEEIFYKQVELLKEHNLTTLFKLQCMDLLVLEEMEYNGSIFDCDEAEKEAIKLEEKIADIEKELVVDYEDIPINWNSRDHLSCYIYGGKITYETRLEIGVYKSGAKVGLPRYKILTHEFVLPRLVEPPKGSELLKEGYYATDEPTLRSIRASAASRQRILRILERSQYNKLLGTYYRGLPKLITEMDWPSNKLHGTLNQCVAATGRLSSSRPNLQNFAGEIKGCLKSRYN